MRNHVYLYQPTLPNWYFIEYVTRGESNIYSFVVHMERHKIEPILGSKTNYQIKTN